MTKKATKKVRVPRRLYTLVWDDGTEERLGRTTLDAARRQAMAKGRLYGQRLEVAASKWSPSLETWWLDIEIRDARDELAAKVAVQIDPVEPACASAKARHDWREDGAHGGGVIRHRCERCDRTRTTDTGAQHPVAGQGLTSMCYGWVQDEN